MPPIRLWRIEKVAVFLQKEAPCPSVVGALRAPAARSRRGRFAPEAGSSRAAASGDRGTRGGLGVRAARRRFFLLVLPSCGALRKASVALKIGAEIRPRRTSRRVPTRQRGACAGPAPGAPARAPWAGAGRGWRKHSHTSPARVTSLAYGSRGGRPSILKRDGLGDDAPARRTGRSAGRSAGAP